MGFSFPATTTGLGWSTAADERFTPLALMGHPGTFLLVSCLLGYVTYRRTGLWRQGAGTTLVRQWASSLPASSTSIVLLAMVATVLVQSGMVATLAVGTAQVAGSAFLVLSALVGALGSLVTGSTTSSNALFAALQRDVAELIGAPPTVLLAAQTAGGNVGNALAPVVILIGATAVDAVKETPRILRATLGPAAVLLTVVALSTALTAMLIGSP